METKKRLFSRRKRDKLNSSSLSKTRSETRTDDESSPKIKEKGKVKNYDVSSTDTKTRAKNKRTSRQKVENIPVEPDPSLCLPRTPERQNPDKMEVENEIDESPVFLYSQAPRPEVYWDDNTPQMRKHRAKMLSLLNQTSEEESSPVRTMISSPILQHSPSADGEDQKDGAIKPLIGHDLVATQIALEGIMEFNRKIEMQKEIRAKQTETVINNKNIPHHVRARISDNFDRTPKSGISGVLSKKNSPKSDSGDAFSDDDSLLLQCTQEVEDKLFATAKTSPVFIKADNNCNSDMIDGFESDESFELFMSQMDESEAVSKKESNKENSDLKTSSSKKVMHNINTAQLQDQRESRQPSNSSLKNPHPSFRAGYEQPPSRSDQPQVPSTTATHQSDSPTSSRPIKKFRSSDDGLRGRNVVASGVENAGGGGGTPLRRIQSDNNVTASSNAVEVRSSCTQQMIEKKKLEAKMKRQLRSQMK